MSHISIPRLRREAIVRPFDDRGTLQRFVIAVDGQHFVVTPTVAAVLEETRCLRVGEDDFETLAARVSHRLGTTVAGRDLERLLRERVPRSLVEAVESPPSASPISLQCMLLSGRSLSVWLDLATHLFTLRRAVALILVAAVIEICLALRTHGPTPPGLTALGFALSLALTLLGVLLHELGHLAACRRFGGAHGGIGVGVYWLMPAFYAEVHGAWLLPRRQRAVVDAGGVYFQAIFVAGLAAVQLCAPSAVLTNAIAWSHLLMLHTLNPVLKFDGYWLLCDLAGAHNLHRDIRDIAARLLERRWPSKREAALLSAFATAAAVYFCYVLSMLGASLGSAAGALSATLPGAPDDPEALLAAAGHAALLALLAAMSLGLAILLARALNSIANSTTPTGLAAQGALR